MVVKNASEDKQIYKKLTPVCRFCSLKNKGKGIINKVLAE